jgi:hypothetical protein
MDSTAQGKSKVKALLIMSWNFTKFSKKERVVMFAKQTPTNASVALP